MFEVSLKPPKKKRRRKSEALKQSLPVPIASLTDVKANDSLWRVYHGIFDPDHGKIWVRDSQEAKYIKELGFFGSTGDPKLPKNHRNGRSKDVPSKRKGSRRKEAEKSDQISNTSLVTLEDFQLSKEEIRVEDDDVVLVVSDEDEPPLADFSEANPDAEVLEVQELVTKPRQPTSELREDDVEENNLQLSCAEAFFLTYALGCLIISEKETKTELTIDELWTLFSTVQKDFPYHYAVYHHFRAKGYVVKDGVKYGTDFLLYKDGPPFYHAQYSVRIRVPEASLNWKQVCGLNRVTESASKELLLAQIKCDTKDFRLPKCLKCIQVQEMLLRRWVPSQERHDAT